MRGTALSRSGRSGRWASRDDARVKTVDIESVFRAEAGRALATLIRLVGDFEYAEDALQDAFAAALAQWPGESIPLDPRAWLVEVGRRKAIDRIRRRSSWQDKQRELQVEAAIGAQAVPDEPNEQLVADDMLRLIFTCCHPALPIEAQVALTLRAVCGLATGEIARAFLVGEETMAQRLVRAKSKIRTAKIPYETPDATMLDERVDGVLAAIYLVFTEGYAPTEGRDLLREDLSREAIRLGRLLHQLMPQQPGVQGLLALMLLHDARRQARSTADGDIIRLEIRIAACGIVRRSSRARRWSSGRCACPACQAPMRCRLRSRHCMRRRQATSRQTGVRSRVCTMC